MRLIIASLFVIGVSSCSPSEEYSEEIFKVCQHAERDLGYQVDILRHHLQRYMQESPQKYGELNTLFNSCDSKFKELKLKTIVTEIEYLNFLEMLKITAENNTEGVHFWLEDKLKDSFFDFKDSISTAVIKLSLTTYMAEFSSIVIGEIPMKGCYKFIGFESYPTGFNSEKGRYSFSLLSDDIQQFKYKNYQIDSVLFNGSPRHLQNEILPSVCSIITIQSEEQGDYQVYGHMDFMNGRGIGSIPFEHSFTKK